MEYPEQIVCHSFYQERFPLDSLNTNDFCVSRRIDGKIEDCVETIAGKSILDPDCLGVIVGMSVNLLGGLFMPEHTLLIQKGEGKNLWDGKTEIRIEDFPNCYRVHDGDYVFYRASLIHNVDYPVDVQMQNKEQYKAYQTAIKKTFEEEYYQDIITRITVTLKLVSMPTNLNYWHLEMKTMFENGKEIKNDDSYRKLIFNHILNHILCREFQLSNDTRCQIAPEVYVKTA